MIKIGSSSLIHEETGGLDYIKLEKLVRIISDLKNQDKDVVLVSSGAIGVGSKSLGLQKNQRQHHSDRHVQQLDRDSS